MTHILSQNWIYTGKDLIERATLFAQRLCKPSYITVIFKTDRDSLFQSSSGFCKFTKLWNIRGRKDLLCNVFWALLSTQNYFNNSMKSLKAEVAACSILPLKYYCTNIFNHWNVSTEIVVVFCLKMCWFPSAFITVVQIQAK